MSLREWVRGTVWPRRDLAGQLGYLALRPLSSVFRAAVGLRGLGYRLGILRTRRAAVPVISVGNLVVGGTGKTPLALWLGRALVARGLCTAIVSRGYGGRAAGVTVVSRGYGPEVGPDLVGDEAVMVAKSFAGLVVTSPRRIDGAAAAVRWGCDVIVLDDGFQHRAIDRAFDLVLVDGSRGPLLPAGPLRETPRALRRADAIVLLDEGIPGGASLDLPADKPAYRMQLEPAEVVESVGGRWRTHPLAYVAGKRVVVVAGIAHPERLYALLRPWEAVIEEVFEFPDHHRYQPSEWQRITRSSLHADMVVTTEKDLVKLEAFPFAMGKLVAVRVTPRVCGGEQLIASILERIRPELARRGGEIALGRNGC